jgi:hypothetical protein
VLVLVPTRELAAQVLESVRVYGAHTGLRSLAVFGGVGINPQIQTLRRGIDILVATPGRLLDHLGQRTVDLSKVQTLVLDEADRMFDMGFIRDIRRIIERLPKVRQNLMFSATFAAEVRELAHTVLKDPAMVEVARRNAPAELVTHTVIKVDQDRSATCCCISSPPTAGTRCWCSAAPSTAPTRWPKSSSSPACAPRRCTATSRRTPAPGRWPTSRPASWRRWSPPTSPRADSTSIRCRAW